MTWAPANVVAQLSALSTSPHPSIRLPVERHFTTAAANPRRALSIALLICFALVVYSSIACRVVSKQLVQHFPDGRVSERHADKPQLTRDSLSDEVSQS